MAFAARATRATSHQRIPVPSSALRPHPRLSSLNGYRRVFHPNRSHISTTAGTQAPEHPRDLPPHVIALLDELHRKTTPRGDRSINKADRIQDELEEQGHRVWGFVIYRCTYGDDAAWEKCLERLNAAMRECMRRHNGLELLEEGCFKLTVIAGARFNGVKTQYVREHFKEWRKQAIIGEQGSPEEIEARRKPPPEPPYHPRGTAGLDESAWARGLQEASLLPLPDYVLPHLPRPGPCSWQTERPFPAPRYRFCVQIDEAAMRSILSMDESNAWVNVIDADWRSKDAAIEFEEAWVDLVDGGYDKDRFDHYVNVVLPEIEGCVEENVGWMKVDYNDAMTGFYTCMIDPGVLEEYLYQRPPTMLPPGLCT
jgi:hypothetical protein